MRLVLATHNKGKLREFREILRDRLGKDLGGLELVSAADLGVEDPVETGTTFTENSALKARFVSEKTGLPAVADDSGLIVDVLGRAPGILSARWSGRHGDDKANLELLLAQVRDIPDERRTARFECVATLVIPAGVASNRSDKPLVLSERGEMTGLLAREPRGKNGFGYDPIFLPDDQPQEGEGAAAAGRNGKDKGVHKPAGEGAGASGTTDIPAAPAPEAVSVPRPTNPDPDFAFAPAVRLDAQEAKAALTNRLSAAQLTPAQKDAISHRGKAMRKIAKDIEVYLGAE